MAITREQILAAVEKYLPRTVNYAQSADMADRDAASVFQRIQQITFTNLLVEPDTVFYLIFLAIQRLLVDVALVITLLEQLQGEQQLKAITGDVPVRIEDLTKLSAARRSLVRLSTGLVVDGNFGSSALTDFQGELEGFMADELVPNVSGGNRAQISVDIRATMASLQTAWATVVERRDLVFTLLDKYTAEDLRTRVSTTIIAGIQETLQVVESTILLLTTDEQAEQSEAILVDLAAAEAALNIVGDAPSATGTIIAGPTVDGRTESEYLVIEGTGQTEPTRPLLKGEAGQLLLEGPNAGAPFGSLLGNTIAPGSGTLTFELEDGGAVDYVAEGVLSGMYVTFVDLGRTHEITTVTSSKLTLNMALTHRPGEDLKYAITDHAVGRYFQDLAHDFWVEYSPGGGGVDTAQAAGVAGDFVRQIKVSASDGTNVAASGVGMTLRPRLTSGTLGTITSGLSNLSDAGASFLSDLIEAGDKLVLTTVDIGTYDVAAVNSETDLDRTGTWGASSSVANWYLEDANSDDQFQKTGENFLALVLDPSPILRVVLAPINGLANVDFTIDNFVSQDLGEVTGGTGTWVFDVLTVWEILNAGNTRLYSDSVDFISEAVIIGDRVDVVGEGTNYEVTAVGQGYVDVTPAFSGPSFTSAFEVFSAVDTGVSNRFVQSTADFVALDIDSLMNFLEYRSGVSSTAQVATVLEVDGVSYSVQGRDPVSPTTTLIINPLSAGEGEFTTTTTFEDTTASWQTQGVDPTKHELVIQSGANTGTVFALLSVDSETEITTAAPASVASNEIYEILPKVTTSSTLAWEARAGDNTRNFLDKHGNSPFTLTSEGQVLVWNLGGVEVRSAIDTFISTSEVWLVDSIPYDSDADYAIQDVVLDGAELIAAGRRYIIAGVASRHALDVDPKLSNAPGKNIDWHIRLAGATSTSLRVEDPSLTALSLPGYPGGFPGARDPTTGGFLTPNDFSGYRVDLMAANPVRARYVKGIDADGDLFAESFQIDVALPLGLRNIAYKILQDLQGVSDVFLAEEILPLPLQDDYLNVWTLEDVFVLSADATSVLPDMSLPIIPSAPSGLDGRDYVVTRGGSQYHGRYILMENFNDALDINDDTTLLRLRAAEVLIDFGVQVVAIDSGLTGEVANDGDDDGLADVFTDVTTPADFSQTNFGDRLTVTYPGGEVEVTFISAILGDSTARVDPPLSEGTALVWTLERNSVSATLEEAELLRTQMIELQGILEGYIIPRNAVVEGIISMLEDQRLQRAIDLLYDGEIDKFVNLTSSSSSYSARARVSIQTVGARAAPTDALMQNVGGVDPETGQPATSSVGATSPSSTAGSIEDVDTRVAFARAVADLVGDETMRSLAYATFEEQRNRAIYELTGEVRSGFISDTDATLPWIQVSGSARAKVNERFQKARDAIQYMLDHPDEFREPTPLEDS